MALPSHQDDADKVTTELGPPLITQGHATDEGQRHDSANLHISVALALAPSASDPSASAPLLPANSPGVVLIPPTPQTLQKEKVYMVSPLLPPSQIERQRPQMDHANVAEINNANDQLIAKELQMVIDDASPIHISPSLPSSCALTAQSRPQPLLTVPLDEL